MTNHHSVRELIEAEAGAVLFFDLMNNDLDRQCRQLFEYAHQDHQKRLALLELELRKQGITFSKITAKLPEEVNNLLNPKASERVKIQMANILQANLTELYQQVTQEHPRNSIIHRLARDQDNLAKRIEMLEQSQTSVLPPNRS